eukprot:PhM_4_TR3447/c0_g1_i2/m.21928/K05850/ATP2B; Ca2+ transporting ATPase, plasma membrane
MQGVNPIVKTIQTVVERQDREALGTALGGTSGLVSTLNADVELGVKSSSLEQRRRDYGWNKLESAEPVTFLSLVREGFEDHMVQLLVVSAIVSIILGMTMKDPHTGKVERSTGWIEGTAILISMAVVVLVGAGNNYQKAKKFEELEKQQTIRMVQVIRDGVERTVDSTEVVVGDIIIIEAGAQLVCDSLVLSGQDLKTNESAMTGESESISKHVDGNVFLLSGTLVEEGSGRALVIAVGAYSLQGTMHEKTSQGNLDETPLQIKLGQMADDIGKAGMGIALLLFLSLSMKEVFYMTAENNHDLNISVFLRYLIVCVTVIVVCIPEGLPLAVTIALAYGMKAMMKDNCMVRILSSCETMGAATAVCSDKTGTLTTNVMTVVQGYLYGEEFLIDGYGIVTRPDAHVTKVKRATFELDTPDDRISELAAAIAHNSTAQEQVVDGEKVWIGNKTEGGLLRWLRLLDIDYKTVREDVPHSSKRVYPFSSLKKRMTTLVREGDDKKGTLVGYCKGASEIVLEECTTFKNRDGTKVTMSIDDRMNLNKMISHMASQGNRTMAIATFTPSKSSSEFPETEPECSEMCLLAILGIQDPIRPEVPLAVAKAAGAKVTVRMVTGDNINTAIAIGKKCGIYEDNGYDVAMLGVDFRAMYEKERDKLVDIVPRLRILARSSPTDKYILVQMLQDAGEVVGVTGDGSNDAPALKLSNVGFAMNSGTDIAKGSAHMILIDDNFATVITAIKWGRAVNDNIRKFLQFQLTVNVAGCLLTFIGALMSDRNEEPLKPVQLLWLNLIMDTLAALALATERPEERSLQRPPVYLGAPLMSRRMICFILAHSVFQLSVMISLVFKGHSLFKCDDSNDDCTDAGGSMDGGYCMRGPQHNTIIFNTFIWMQIVNEFNARKLYGEMLFFEGLWERSKYFIGVQMLTVAFQVFAVEVAGSFMSTTGLTWQQWFGCIGFSLLEIPMGFFQRLIPVTDVIPEDVVQRHHRDEEIMKKLKFENPHMHAPQSASGSATNGSTTLVRPGQDRSLRQFRDDSSDIPGQPRRARGVSISMGGGGNNGSRDHSLRSDGNATSHGEMGGSMHELKAWLGSTLRQNHEDLRKEITELKKEVQEVQNLKQEVAELRSALSHQHSEMPNTPAPQPN